MPDILDYPGGCHVYESVPEALISLQCEDELLICVSRTVVRKIVISYPQKSRLKYMLR